MPFYGSLNNWYFDVDASHLKKGAMLKLEDEKCMAIFHINGPANELKWLG